MNNWALSNLKMPELHIPGYNHCGPYTKLQERFERGDEGMEMLNEACKGHDITYHENKA